MSAIFVTGTDTGVGKTVVSAWLAHHWQADYWKPIQSGLEEASDSEWVHRWSGRPCHPEVYRLRTPVSPHLAARLDGRHIELASFVLPHAPRLIVEGAGGVMVPLNEDELMLDLMRRLGLPVLLVARAALGTINHTLLSVRALREAGLEVLGVVLNGPQDDGEQAAVRVADTLDTIERFARVRVLDHLHPWLKVDAPALAAREPAAPLRDALRALGTSR